MLEDVSFQPAQHVGPQQVMELLDLVLLGDVGKLLQEALQVAVATGGKRRRGGGGGGEGDGDAKGLRKATGQGKRERGMEEWRGGVREREREREGERERERERGREREGGERGIEGGRER